MVVRHAMLVVARAGLEIVEIPFHEPPFVAAGARGQTGACSGKLARQSQHALLSSVQVVEDFVTGHHMVALQNAGKSPDEGEPARCQSRS